MKRTLSFVLFVAVLLIVAVAINGCSEKELKNVGFLSSPTAPPPPPPEEEEEEPEPVVVIPVANFRTTIPPGSLSVEFIDLSINNPTSWSWNFGDLSGTSSVQNPLHTYAAAGTYEVRLTASNSAGDHTVPALVTVPGV